MRRLYVAVLSFLYAFSLSLPLTAGEEPSKPKHPIAYTWELDSAAQERIFAGVRALRYHDSISTAKELLGNPDHEDKLQQKDGKFIGYALEYNIKLVKIGLPNMRDQVISLSFNTDGRLHTIIYSAMNPIAGNIIRSSQTTDGDRFIYTMPPTRER